MGDLDSIYRPLDDTDTDGATIGGHWPVATLEAPLLSQLEVSTHVDSSGYKSYCPAKTELLCLKRFKLGFKAELVFLRTLLLRFFLHI